MSVEIKGKVIVIGEVITGTTASGKEWKSQNFVIEEIEGQYPQKISLEVLNKDLEMNIGDVINAHVNLSSREYNGRWYSSIKLWKFDVIDNASNSSPTPNTSEQSQSATNEPSTDDLPF